MKRISWMLAVLLLAGCGTISSKIRGDMGVPYSGVACAYNRLNDPPTGSMRQTGTQLPGEELMLGLFAADVPVSLVADTLVLPVDLMMENPDVAEQRMRLCGRYDFKNSAAEG